MITERKLVLVFEKPDEMDFVCRFEAMKRIDSIKDVVPTWRLNKTPVILQKYAIRDHLFDQYDYVYAPQYIFGGEYFPTFAHNNGFECGEFISGKKFDTRLEHCFLCSVAKAKKSNGKIKSAPFAFDTKVADLTLYESKNFFVKIELGCMLPGMVMICPKAHLFSSAEIDDSEMEEFESVKKDIEFLLHSIYGIGPVIFFEHGSSASVFSTHERSIVHAHVHVAWGITLEKKYQDMVCLEEVPNLKHLKHHKYFSYQEGCDGKLLAVYNPEVYVQRQYPRQVIGKQLGIPNEKTNWRVEPFIDNVAQTYKDFYTYIINNKDFLSKRIVSATEDFVSDYELFELDKS